MATLADTQRTLVKEAYAAWFKQPTAASRAHAKTVLLDPTAPATAIFIAARHLLGPTFLSYEPETLWLELDIHVSNRDKLMASIALTMTPAFYWDYRVFGATVHAFNHELVLVDSPPKASAAHMAWASFEAELIFALGDEHSTTPEYDFAVEAYVGVTLFDDGFVCPPSGLSFAANDLATHIDADSKPFAEEVKNAWAALPKEKIDLSSFKDDALGAQLLKLADSWLYVTERTRGLRRYLESF